MTRLFEVAQGVAPLLKGQWRYNQLAAQCSEHRAGNRAVLNDDTKPRRQIIFRPAWHTPGRIELYGLLPTDYPSNTKITVAETRSVPAIASDINRRLLPGFLAEWTEAEARCQKREAEMELYRHQVDLLRRFVPEFAQYPNRGRLTGSDEFYFRDGRLQLFSSGFKASLRLSLPFDEMVRVLMALYDRDN
jgi:hypothetical protein